jgi:hypothetical protein
LLLRLKTNKQTKQYIVKGLIDKKIQDSRRYIKGKQQSSIIIQTRAMILALNPMFSGSRNSSK